MDTTICHHRSTLLYLPLFLCRIRGIVEVRNKFDVLIRGIINARITQDIGGKRVGLLPQHGMAVLRRRSHISVDLGHIFGPSIAMVCDIGPAA